MFDVDDLVADCKSAMAEAEPRLAVKEVLEEAVTRATLVASALPADRACFAPLYTADDLSVMHVVWGPGMRIPPHNHLMWSAVGLYDGREDNMLYRRVGSDIAVSGGKELSTGDVAVLGDDTIHAVHNPLGRFTCAIHVYGGDITTRAGRSEWNADTFEEAPFDFKRAQQYFVIANSEATTSSDARAGYPD